MHEMTTIRWVQQKPMDGRDGGVPANQVAGFYVDHRGRLPRECEAVADWPAAVLHYLMFLS
jgi:hypothetical protein